MPPTYPAAWPVAFVVVPTVTNNAAPVTFDWDFGDGSAHSTNQYAAHAYTLPGTYNWSVTSTVSAASTTNNGSIVIGNPVQLGIARAGSQVTLSWPNTIADTLLEGTGVLGPSAQWLWVTNAPTVGPSLHQPHAACGGQRVLPRPASLVALLTPRSRRLTKR